MITPRERVALAPLTTLGVGGDAAFLVDGVDEGVIVEALAWARERGLAVRILGGGSNVVVPDGGFDGLVVRVLTRGVTYGVAGSDALVEASAGEPWDELVRESVGRELQGLECLSGIPGLVGATPIQNVGAYGQEVAETLASVRVLDRETLAASVFTREECRFAYRDSYFKSHAPERYVVLTVRFALRRLAPPAVRYAELVRRLEADGVGGSGASLARVRETVLDLRRQKSMVLDQRDENARSCGSFFVNPVVTREHASRIEAATGISGMPRYPQPDDRVKLAAGWLIEQAGFHKGARRGAVGLSSKHALALVCHEGATAGDVLALAGEIQRTVEARFGVRLEREPVLFA